MPLLLQPNEFIFNRYKEAIWHGNRNSNYIYLTFDDGPTPQVSDKVLELLEKKNIKATFFCIGQNVIRYPDLYNQILKSGHLTANHTHQHLNLFRCGWKKYEQDILQCTKYVTSSFFRPPYGRITRSAIRKIHALGMKTVLWDLITYDFSPSLEAQHCIHLLRKRLRPGSVIVFHDSIKAAPRMFPTLEFLITYAGNKGLSFRRLDELC